MTVTPRLIGTPTATKTVGNKIADQGISALQSDLANGLNIIGHDGNNGQTYNRPTDAPVTAARDSEAV